MSNLQSKPSQGDLKEKVAAIAGWLDEHKALDVAVVDLEGCQAFADTLIVCSAQSARQAQALASGLAEFCRERDYEFLGMEGRDAAQWILVDMNDIVVNIFQEQSRLLYRLEDLWRVAGDQAAAAKRENI